MLRASGLLFVIMMILFPRMLWKLYFRLHLAKRTLSLVSLIRAMGVFTRCQQMLGEKG